MQGSVAAVGNPPAQLTDADANVNVIDMTALTQAMNGPRDNGTFATRGGAGTPPNEQPFFATSPTMQVQAVGKVVHLGCHPRLFQ